ncbi:hypothetical protein H181DRAFT_03931 [Streptomyces sp. WMMB 714]|uniref:hypothetical protein n=1 Tax=Streptomyces sp. WMMB 714 TaxID=1286822 RepID=UPI0005F86B5C|nr:hypothetical protein [Streptomyces sp. WMMB 714]SCK44484.1 hypothetical protein H181DRAFT_03931 [Streptomyces sp. WMMB 714]
MNRSTGYLLAGLASAIGAGLLHNRWSGRGEHLHATVFSEPGYRGRTRYLTWTGGKPKVVPLRKAGLPRVGSIKIERSVYRFRPAVRLPNLPLLWYALTEPSDPEDPEENLLGLIALNELASTFSAGYREPVRPSAARSGVRLRAGHPGAVAPARGRRARSGRTAPGTAASGKGAASGAEPWHDVLADTSDLASWGTRVRYLELGYLRGRFSR